MRHFPDLDSGHGVAIDDPLRVVPVVFVAVQARHRLDAKVGLRQRLHAVVLQHVRPLNRLGRLHLDELRFSDHVLAHNARRQP